MAEFSMLSTSLGAPKYPANSVFNYTKTIYTVPIQNGIYNISNPPVYGASIKGSLAFTTNSLNVFKNGQTLATIPVNLTNVPAAFIDKSYAVDYVNGNYSLAKTLVVKAYYLKNPFPMNTSSVYSSGDYGGQAATGYPALLQTLNSKVTETNTVTKKPLNLSPNVSSTLFTLGANMSVDFIVLTYIYHDAKGNPMFGSYNALWIDPNTATDITDPARLGHGIFFNISNYNSPNNANYNVPNVGGEGVYYYGGIGIPFITGGTATTLQMSQVVLGGYDANGTSPPKPNTSLPILKNTAAKKLISNQDSSFVKTDTTKADTIKAKTPIVRVKEKEKESHVYPIPIPVGGRVYYNVSQKNAESGQPIRVQIYDVKGSQASPPQQAAPDADGKISFNVPNQAGVYVIRFTGIEAESAKILVR